MIFKFTYSRITFSANLTFKRSDSIVSHFVDFEGMAVCKLFPAFFTLIGFFSSVNLRVRFEISLERKLFSTFFTFVRLCVTMYKNVAIKLGLGNEQLLTIFAFELLLFCM